MELKYGTAGRYDTFEVLLIVLNGIEISFRVRLHRCRSRLLIVLNGIEITLWCQAAAVKTNF